LGEGRHQAGWHLKRPVAPPGLWWAKDIALGRPLAITSHVEDAFVQVHVGPGETGGLAGPQAEQEHGEPHGFVRRTGEGRFERPGLVVSEGTAILGGYCLGGGTGYHQTSSYALDASSGLTSEVWSLAVGPQEFVTDTSITMLPAEALGVVLGFTCVPGVRGVVRAFLSRDPALLS